MHIECAVTEGEQPIGCAIGPVLEAREALETLMGSGPPDLIDKATSLAGILFEMVGEENGKEKAKTLLASGNAEEKMRQIIEAQGGDREVKPEDLEVGDKWTDVMAQRSGRILGVDNRAIARIARTAGAPNDKGSGLRLMAKLGDSVSEGEPLFRIYAENAQRCDQAAELAEELNPISVGSRIGETMLIKQIKGMIRPGARFTIER
jgi:AMP phosphorylase